MLRSFHPNAPDVREMQQHSPVRVTPSSGPGGPKQNRKSVRVGLVCNLLPGTGVIYAGKSAIGVLYLVTVVVLLFTPLQPLAIVVVLLSYVHTAVAVSNRNQDIEQDERPAGTLIPPPSAFQSKATTMSQVGGLGKSCSRCGGRVSQSAKYCKVCGQLLDQTQVYADLPRPDQTQVYE